MEDRLSCSAKLYLNIYKIEYVYFIQVMSTKYDIQESNATPIKLKLNEIHFNDIFA